MYGKGKVIEVSPGWFRGGVAEPKLKNKLVFAVFRCEKDENGIFNPVEGEGAYKGAFQLSIHGTSAGYRELARYLLAIAELDTSVDEGFHIHHDGLIGLNKRTQVDVILRKSKRLPK